MRTKLLLALAATLALSTGSAIAQENSYYGVLGYQNSKLDLNTSGLDDLGFNTSKDDNGLNFGVGYQVNENLSFEFGYMDMGKVLSSAASFSATSGVISGNIGNDTYSWSAGIAGSADVQAEADGWSLGAVFALPVEDNFDLLAKAGLYRWDAKAKLNASLNANETLTINGVDYTSTAAFTVSADVSENGTDPYYGLGMSYDVSEDVAIRADYTRYEVWDQDIDAMSAALIVKF